MGMRRRIHSWKMHAFITFFSDQWRGQLWGEVRDTANLIVLEQWIIMMRSGFELGQDGAQLFFTPSCKLTKILERELYLLLTKFQTTQGTVWNLVTWSAYKGLNLTQLNIQLLTRTRTRDSALRCICTKARLSWAQLDMRTDNSDNISLWWQISSCSSKGLDMPACFMSVSVFVWCAARWLSRFVLSSKLAMCQKILQWLFVNSFLLLFDEKKIYIYIFSFSDFFVLYVGRDTPN